LVKANNITAFIYTENIVNKGKNEHFRCNSSPSIDKIFQK